MPWSDFLLYRLSKAWPSLKSGATARIGGVAGTEDHEHAYAQDQFNQKVRHGLTMPVNGLEVLEVGCGHGGITVYLALAGAKSVTGIDINVLNLERARRFADDTARRFGEGCKLPIEFREMDAYEMTFALESFDLVICDNSIEHFTRPEAVVQQAARVLRRGGRLLVPAFSSIYSKYGLHLKQGLKVPWANLFFSERTIIRAMQRRAQDDPHLRVIYPGLDEAPERVCDLRRYKDLNDITYAEFKRIAARANLKIEWFRPTPTHFGLIVRRLPWLRNSLLMDVFSTGAAACLRKPA